MRALSIFLAVVGFATTSCSMMPPPVPVTGPPAEVSALAGSWSGDYASAATRRQGSIRFTLSAGKDTAFGDVFMLSRRPIHTVVGREGANIITTPSPSASTLRIAFVHAADGSVSGSLDPYEDPDCGCILVTWFSGRLVGGRIEGRYMSRNTETGALTSGEWSVRRQREKPTSKLVAD